MKALDQCGVQEGFTPLLLAASMGQLKTFTYLLAVIKKRDKMIARYPSEFDAENYMTLEHHLEFRNSSNFNAFLVAAKADNIDILRVLHEEGANVYGQCTKFQNALHYATINDNEEMIKYLISVDAEKGWLISQEDVKSKKPRDYDFKKRYGMGIFDNVWNLV